MYFIYRKLDGLFGLRHTRNSNPPFPAHPQSRPAYLSFPNEKLLPFKIGHRVPDLLGIFLFSVLFIVILSISWQGEAFAGGVYEFLCDLGEEYYEQGRWLEALHEFKKALILYPRGEKALRYVETIEVKLGLREEELVIEPIVIEPEEELRRAREAAIEEALREARKKLRRPIEEVLPPPLPVEEVALPVKRPPLKRLILDEEVRATQPGTRLEVELGDSFIIEGRSIERFLVISPDIISVEKKSVDEIEITGERIGRSYLHLWDGQGRWTFNIQVVLPRPAVPTLAEKYRRELERAEMFTLRYSLDWGLYYTGEQIDALQRTSYPSSHWLGLDGDTPYGRFDSGAHIKAGQTTDLTYLTMGLSDGRIGRFRDFDLRVFDYDIGLSPLSLPGRRLRGAKLDAKAFQNLSYALFWGQEGIGRYGGLSPGVAETIDSFITGGRLSYHTNRATHSLYYCGGYGPERQPYLKRDVIALESDYALGNYRLGYEVGYDGDTLAYLLNSTYALPKLRLTGELRDIDEEYVTITGRPARSGELGGLFTYSYLPSSDLQLSGRLDIFKDRLFPHPQRPDRLNVDFGSEAALSINPTTGLRFDYGRLDEMGRLSPRRSERIGVGLSKTFNLPRRLGTFLSYRHHWSEHPDSPSLDYTSDGVRLGLRYSLTPQLSAYLSQDINWLEEEFTGERTLPRVLETGLDYSSQIGKTPFYGVFRLRYRDEEEAISPLAFLAGEDSLEVGGELTYKPSPDLETFLSCRLRDVWPDDLEGSERVEFEVRTGLRWLFGTGLRWEPLGTVEGVVFKDINGDGLRQEGEPGAEGVKIFLGREKFLLSDRDGRYRFERVRAKKAHITIDVATLPTGFVLTTPARQEVKIIQGGISEVDFGIIARSEIYGVVFNDLNRNGKFDSGEEGIPRVVLRLEDGTEAVTSDKGEYYFRGIPAGEHTITLDINSLPIRFLPQVPLSKRFILFEGITFIHHLPVAEVGG